MYDTYMYNLQSTTWIRSGPIEHNELEPILPRTFLQLQIMTRTHIWNYTLEHTECEKYYRFCNKDADREH